MDLVYSSSIDAIGYASDAELLDVRFASSHVWRHAGVPAGVVEALLSAASISHFYERCARNRFDHLDLSDQASN